MFEFGEIREINEIDELYKHNSEEYKYTSDEIWKMGKAAIEELFKANKDILFPEEGAAIKKHKNPCEKQYQAAMQAAQELANSGYYTLEQAIQIVMANL